MADMRVTEISERLLERINRLPVVDTHEHMLYEKIFIQGQYDFTRLMTYLGLDLEIAGFPCGLWQTGQFAVQEGEDIGEKWRRIKPFWPHVRTGVYGTHFRRLLKRFFGVDDLNDETVCPVSEKIKEYQYPGVYRVYLLKKYGIRVMMRVQDASVSEEPEYFANACYLGHYLDCDSSRQAAEKVGLKELPKSFEEYRMILVDTLRAAFKNGAVSLKIGFTARRRALDFVGHSDLAAEESYRFWAGSAEYDWLDEKTQKGLKPFQDTIYWTAFETAGELGLPVQVHSGLEFPQPWAGRPSCLIPSLIRFPQTKFAVMHGSYPYLDELTGLARSFPNVYIDLAWLHMLSRVQTRAWLAEWLDVIPHNKIFAFGGDELMFFGCCAHLELARENVAGVLAERVAEGRCDLDEAEQCARKLFHDNPWTTFAFQNRKTEASS